MDFIDPVLDLLEFIILLAGVCAVCISLTLETTKDIQNLAYTKTYDKTVSLTQGEKSLGEITVNESFTAEEIAMCVASQNSYIAAPSSAPNIEDPYDYQKALEYIEKQNGIIDNYLIIGSKKINLTGRAQYDTSTASEVLSAIQTWKASNTSADVQGYRVMFYINTSSEALDNVYALYYIDSNNKYHLCK